MQENILLIVDDQEINRDLLEGIFDGDNFKIVMAENGQQAVDIIKKKSRSISAVLLDLVMPIMDGFEVLQWMSKEDLLTALPVFVITSADDQDILADCYRLGAIDIIMKPFVPSFLKNRIHNTVDLFKARKLLSQTVTEQNKLLSEQAEKLFSMNSSIIDMLATVVEFRDGETGEHVRNLRIITMVLISQYIKLHPDCGITTEDLICISDAAVLHDIGKIAIPDQILNKPGKLTQEEFEIMKTHSAWGCKILESMPSLLDPQLYEYCYDICRHHHERWDGNGYPDGLKGDDISIWTQAVSIADVYDALVSKRVYKDAYTPEQAIKMIFDGECGQFNPEMLECFKLVTDVIQSFYKDKKNVDLKKVMYECYRIISA